MCNLAGYTGSRQAAPVLIEMLRKQEGLDSGFFTGIATLHEGKIYYAKAAGDLDHLLATTNAASLPGTVGIIHSRTPGKPDDNWAHPFVTCQKGEPVIAFATNGIAGCRGEEYQKIVREDAWMLRNAGFSYTSVRPASGKRLDMGDGTMIHPSEVQTHYIGKQILEGVSPVEAMEHCFTHQVKEGAALLLVLSQPGAITWTRTSFPLALSFADHGAYVATAPQGFPGDAGDILQLPALSSGTITADGYTCKKYSRPPFTVAPITSKVLHTAYERIVKALEQPCRFYDLPGLCIDAFEPADCTQKNAAAYQVLAELYRQDLIEEQIHRVPHMEGDMTAPRRYMWLKKR